SQADDDERVSLAYLESLLAPASGEERQAERTRTSGEFDKCEYWVRTLSLFLSFSFLFSSPFFWGEGDAEAALRLVRGMRGTPSEVVPWLRSRARVCIASRWNVDPPCTQTRRALPPPEIVSIDHPELQRRVFIFSFRPSIFLFFPFSIELILCVSDFLLRLGCLHAFALNHTGLVQYDIQYVLAQMLDQR
ncbi:hypothetical protein B0H16DRAFT_1540518, partial [Mycena metata]